MMKKARIYATEDELVTELSQVLQTAATDAIQSRDIFTIGLSGGQMVQQMSKILSNISTDLPKWRFFFCDERIVPFSDTESTYGAYLKELNMLTTNITKDQFITINPTLSAQAAAEDYVTKISNFFPNQSIPKFDVLLLGMGPDGHTCSLFPNHPLLEETSMWVAPITDSPKPPPSRVTFTYPVLNNARFAIFITLGESKADAIEKIFKNNVPLPASRVLPKDGKLLWFMDEKAASLIM